MRLTAQNPGGNAYGSSPWRDILDNHGVGPDYGMVANFHAAENLSSGSDVHMPPQNRCAGFGATHTDGHLLGYQTVRSDNRLRIYDYSVGVR